MAQMDGQMIRIAQMRSSEDEDSDGSEGWSDDQDSSDEELRWIARIVQMKAQMACDDSSDESSHGLRG